MLRAKMFPHGSDSPQAEDQKILDDARELVASSASTETYWGEMDRRIEFYRTPPDHVMIYHDELVLPHLRGKLDADEWKPLVASARLDWEQTMSPNPGGPA
jgi:hypothetical protein